MEHCKWKGLCETRLIPVSLLFPLKPLHYGLMNLMCMYYYQKTVGKATLLANGLKGSDCLPWPHYPHLDHCPPCLPPSSHLLHHPMLSLASLKTNGRGNIDLSVQESKSKKCIYRPLSEARSQPFRDAVERGLT